MPERLQDLKADLERLATEGSVDEILARYDPSVLALVARSEQEAIEILDTFCRSVARE